MTATPTALKIDFVSDVSCPWCIIGLKALEQAADRLKDEVAVISVRERFPLVEGFVVRGQRPDGLSGPKAVAVQHVVDRSKPGDRREVRAGELGEEEGVGGVLQLFQA